MRAVGPQAAARAAARAPRCGACRAGTVARRTAPAAWGTRASRAAPRPLRVAFAEAQEIDAAQAQAAAEEAVEAMKRRDATVQAVLAKLTAAVHGLSLVVEAEGASTAEALLSLDEKLSTLMGVLADPPLPPPAPPPPALDPAAAALAAETLAALERASAALDSHAAAAQLDSEEDVEELKAALLAVEMESDSLRAGNHALQDALETASRLLAQARAEAAEARLSRAAAEEAQAAELQAAHRATAAALAEAAMLRAEKEALEWRVTQTLGLSLHALDDPPLGPPVVRAAPVVPAAYTAAAAYSAAPQPPPLQLPAALAAAHQAAPPAEDMAASLAAAKLRADAAEVSLRKAHFAAANLVAAATTRRSINATVAVSR